MAFVVFEILHNLISMQNFLNANNCWRKQNFENFPVWPYLYFRRTFRIIIWFCLIFSFPAVENVVSFTKSVFIENEAALQCVTMRKRFQLIMATIWFTIFWQNICLVTTPLPPLIPFQKGEVPQPHVFIFFLITSTFSIISTTTNIVISRGIVFRGDPKNSLFRYI